MAESPTTNILPGSWAEWATQIADLPRFRESGAIIRQAVKFSAAAGISPESSAGLLAWLGSFIIHTQTKVEWENGLWHPSALTVVAIEKDFVQIDSITSGFIQVARGLGLDPIQENVKEGPSGLIARLESAKTLRTRKTETKQEGPMSLDQLVTTQVADTETIRVSNAGNVRGLIYPSGRAFFSSLSDTQFFNAVDELIQHGQLHLRGKLDRHAISNLNLTGFWPMYQGALANLLFDVRVQNNFNILLRQLNVFWSPATNTKPDGTDGAAAALRAIHNVAKSGVDSLILLEPAALQVQRKKKVATALIDLGVGIRSVNINRAERVVRFAIAVMFWRIAEGSNLFCLTEEDYAVADVLVHCHDMGARILEIGASKGRIGSEAMKLLMALSSLEYDVEAIGQALAQAHDQKLAADALDLLMTTSVIDKQGIIDMDSRLVTNATIGEHRARWGY
jgi:hypothetical protein